MSVNDNLGVYVAELAANSRTAAREAALSMAERACELMESAPDLQRFRVANVEFHHALVAASGNEMLRFVLEAMDSALGSTVNSAYRGQLSLGELPDSGSVAIHRDLLEAIRGRRVAEARHLALEHARRVRSGAHQRVATVMAGGIDPGEVTHARPHGEPLAEGHQVVESAQDGTPAQ
ncbi:FadR/GntR family transcriptional regulator [Ruania rhizosphaerae]|uniref:FadR/GntR family transcriptional regulator n=1 Tax=Ruania rhizosphaerae TaxID=1840413 RepID=UPI001F30557D|nr:FCD domain-containing protein [Ruania rhizosphaerae]